MIIRVVHRKGVVRSLNRLVGGVGLAGILVSGCLDRPVAPTTPKITARIQEKVAQTAVSKIDLLFMVDNSSSMLDKQQVLAEAVPDLLESLIHPLCVTITQDGNGQAIRTVKGPSTATLTCPPGTELDFKPVNDIHIGIVDSSLGGIGAEQIDPVICNTGAQPHNDDQGHLLSRVSEGAPIEAGFLTWNGKGADTDLTAKFSQMIQGAGQDGCGFEHQLEAVYRFLNDPDPYNAIKVDLSNGRQVATLTGTDNILLQQRKEFLRPDSLVAIVSLSDENENSVQAGGQNFLVYTSDGKGASVYPRGTPKCDEDPDDPCCFNCLLTDDKTPPGCTPASQQSECKTPHTREEDPLNLRGNLQKQKYGASLFYPIERYVNGLRLPKVPDRNGNLANNPLFADLKCGDSGGMGCLPPRDPSLVFYAEIVGVPWQDLAVDPTDLSKGYLTAKELNEKNQWAKIIPEDGKFDTPQGADPFMIESVTPRSGENPFTHEKIAQPGATGLPSTINGHEWDTSAVKYVDLQYACIFPLPTPRDCATTKEVCDCSPVSNPDPKGVRNPLCWDSTKNEYGTTQFRAKAYPGIRQLQMLKKFAETSPDQAIAASICPADLTNKDPQNSIYGYRPAIASIIGRLRQALTNTCLPRQLAPTCTDTTPPAQYGQVPCAVVEVSNPPADQSCCPEGSGRIPADPKLIPDGTDQYRCSCLIAQLSGKDLSTCQTSAADGNGQQANGWCYVDDALYTRTDPTLVQQCTGTSKRIIRFVGEGKSPSGALTYITCQEAGFDPSEPVTGSSNVQKCQLP